jgi:membrane-bound lytic murein transglycosylase A
MTRPCRLFPLLLTLLLLLAACAERAPRPAEPEPLAPEAAAAPDAPLLRAASAAEVDGFLARLSPAGQGLMTWTELGPALEQSLVWLRRKDPAATAARVREADGSLRYVSRAEVAEAVERLRALLPRLDARPGLLRERFAWYALAPDALATGYYAPLIEASLEPGPDYQWPLYAVPEDLESIDLGAFHPRWEGQRLYYRMEQGRPAPYYSRAEIDFQGALAGRGLELAWVADPTDAFYLHVQGSGLLRLPDGSTRRVGYAAKNGRRFRGLGGIIQGRGLMAGQGLSKDNIQAWLGERPALARELMAENPSYVFFQWRGEQTLGALGRPLTPRVSLAVDPALLPLGGVLAHAADLPRCDGPAQRTAGLGLAQDTGGAIKGARLDYYWGEGEHAGCRAQRTRTPAGVFLLLPARAQSGNHSE